MGTCTLDVAEAVRDGRAPSGAAAEPQPLTLPLEGTDTGAEIVVSVFVSRMAQAPPPRAKDADQIPLSEHAGSADAADAAAAAAQPGRASGGAAPHRHPSGVAEAAGAVGRRISDVLSASVRLGRKEEPPQTPRTPSGAQHGAAPGAAAATPPPHAPSSLGRSSGARGAGQLPRDQSPQQTTEARGDAAAVAAAAAGSVAAAARRLSGAVAPPARLPMKYPSEGGATVARADATGGSGGSLLRPSGGRAEGRRSDTGEERQQAGSATDNGIGAGGGDNPVQSAEAKREGVGADEQQRAPMDNEHAKVRRSGSHCAASCSVMFVTAQRSARNSRGFALPRVRRGTARLRTLRTGRTPERLRGEGTTTRLARRAPATQPSLPARRRRRQGPPRQLARQTRMVAPKAWLRRPPPLRMPPRKPNLQPAPPFPAAPPATLAAQWTTPPRRPRRSRAARRQQEGKARRRRVRRRQWRRIQSTSLSGGRSLYA